MTPESTDGFRAIADVDSISAERLNPGSAALVTATFLQELDNGGAKTLILAGDTRPSTQSLMLGVASGAAQQYARVYPLDVAPTPTAQWVAKHTGATATAVVTASHNPAEYNGLKLMPGHRKPRKDEVVRLCEDYDNNAAAGVEIPIRGYVGLPRLDLVDRYHAAVVEKIERTFGQRPLDGKTLIYDGAFGAAKDLAPRIYESLGANVVHYACGEGVINDGCGAADLSGLSEFTQQFAADNPQLVRSNNFLGGLANDGDGDRVMGVGYQPNGNTVEIDGNHLMWAMAQGQEGIVGTTYTNNGLIQKLHQAGIGFEFCENGDANVTRRLYELRNEGSQYSRGGEFTGHIIDLDWLPSGDGLYTGAYYASQLAVRGMTITDTYHDLPLWATYQIKLSHNRTPQQLAKIMEHPELLKTLAHITDEMGESGRHVVRPSGTEPIIRVFTQAPKRENAENFAQRIAASLENVLTTAA